MRVISKYAAALLLLAISESVFGAGANAVHVGSKKFTESVILGELATQLSRYAGAVTHHRKELGGSRVLWNALVAGEIDIYPDYTGTLHQEILRGKTINSAQDLGAALAEFGIRITRPLGFNNTYAIGMLRKRAEALGIKKISDLAGHASLRFGFSNEFMNRADGWPGLRQHYSLPQTGVSGLDHDLAYRGLVNGGIDATDLYSTDAEMRNYDITVLQDDLTYFPDYHAVLLYRTDLGEEATQVVNALRMLQGQIDEQSMTDMNAQAKLDRVPESVVAAEFLARTLNIASHAQSSNTLTQFVRNTKQHLVLVTISLLAAIVVSIPLGILAARRTRLGQIVLAIAGVIQTIPSLALLVFMIPLLGIGGPPAIVALFLYSLLPIIRNTYTGLREIPLEIRESAEALGLAPVARLRMVELPMAMPTILAGIKTSAIINIGTATLGALIGAGGYGQPILTGIRLDDMGLILQGAVPAAGLALLVQGLFELSEHYLVPKGLRL